MQKYSLACTDLRAAYRELASLKFPCLYSWTQRRRNYSISFVEAMNLSIPILVFDCVYNRATTEEKCLYWKIAEDLQNLMKNKSGKFAEIAREMGEAGKRLYSWERIARQYNALYQ